MMIRNKALLIAAAIALVGGLFLLSMKFDGANVLETDTATTTQNPDFEQYPEHTLPEGARAIDQYLYVQGSSVFLNSVAGTSSSELPNIDGATFKRVTDFMVHTDPTIAEQCGKPGSYAYYADAKNIYFYQLWLTPKFKSSKLEGVIGVNEDNFSLTSPTTFSGGDADYKIVYRKATSTCKYYVEPV